MGFRVTHLLRCSFKGLCANESSSKVPVKYAVKERGRVAWWRRAVYNAPVVSPLERGVDFTFQDGRPVFATSQRDLNRKLKQIELGKKIVKLLEEMKTAEILWLESVESEQQKEEEINRWRPLEKGQNEL
ncbi:unnamed protein product [Dracunculus medinensis]|uniref:39S ribosomal protein L52, mitochondrial n=1 Tax=Dracunculus medinensis TaxID=318479 RepID=A0A0N4UFI2_DRAME|nr:unnamed protein product [Dracunculus medinensis]